MYDPRLPGPADRPVIGICTNFSQSDEPGLAAGFGAPGQQWQMVAQDYVRSVEEAGGVPFLIPVLRSPDEACVLAERLDGLLLSGGADIDPARYGEEPAGSHAPSPLRDASELMLTACALKKKMPVLGICRGMQILQVYFGGKLIQDLVSAGQNEHFRTDVEYKEYAHGVRIADGSLLAKIFGRTEFPVNSYHHQAAAAPGEGLTVTAWSEDGIPESLEPADPDFPSFLIGVQWHPEMLPGDPQSAALFRAFVSACKNTRG